MAGWQWDISTRSWCCVDGSTVAWWLGADGAVFGCGATEDGCGGALAVLLLASCLLPPHWVRCH